MNATTESEWRAIAGEMHRAGSTAFFDIAYDGLGKSFSGHAGMIPTFVEEQVPVIAAYSFSKIAGMYSQRVGAVVTLGSSRKDAKNTTNAMNEVVRFQISSQPIPGQNIMKELFRTPHLYQRWMDEELPEMADVLASRREKLANSLPSGDSENVMQGEGMFLLLPISMLGVAKLKDEKGLYVVPTAHGARVNIGGVPSSQIPQLAAGLREGLDKYHT
jgi:aromatic-amino-acid transaminase